MADADKTTTTIAGVLDDAGIDNADDVAVTLVTSYRDNVANFPTPADCADWVTELVGDVFPWDDEDEEWSDVLLETTIETIELALTEVAQ